MSETPQGLQDTLRWSTSRQAGLISRNNPRQTPVTKTGQTPTLPPKEAT